MSELGHSYVIDPDVSGSVNLYTQGEVPRASLLDVLEQLLKLNGQAIVAQEDFYVILPIAKSPKVPGAILIAPEQIVRPEEKEEAPEEAPEGQDPAEPAEPPPTQEVEVASSAAKTVLTFEDLTKGLDDQTGVVTYIIPLHFVPSSEMVKMIQAFVSDGMYNKATEVAEDLGKIFAPDDQAGGVRIIAIERLNSILIISNAPNVLADVKEWLGKLDAPDSTATLKTFIYQVENNVAGNIAEILGQLFSDGTGLPSGPGEDRSDDTQQTTRGQRQQAGFVPEQGGQYGRYQQMLGQRQLGPQLTDYRSGDSIRAAVVTDNVKIIVSALDNSLVIQATDSDYQFLLQTIRQLDVLPRQALIEARIYAVELRDDLSFGVSAFLRALGTDNGPATTGSLSAPGEGTAGGALSIATRIAIGGERQLDLFFNALRTKTDVEILEAPSLLVVDGTEAQINVGAEVPVTTASFGDPIQGGASTTFVNSIQFRPTGTTLLITPRISASGIVTMEVAVEVSNATGQALTPTINRNYVRTSLIAQDNQTVAIAGVISESLDNAQDRIPVLGDIPVIGALFGQTSKKKRRFELIFLITPKVIRTLRSSAELTLEFKRGLRNAYDFIDRVEAEDMLTSEKHIREEAEQQQRLQEQQEKEQPPE
jgi:general secretion pathway protein D